MPVVDSPHAKGVTDKDPRLVFKVTKFDVVVDKPRFSPIHYAFLSGSPGSFAGQEYGKFTCEDGGFCAAYGFFKTPEIAEALLDGNLAITFNRSPGASDVRVPLNISREPAHENFVFCLGKLIPIIEQKSLARRGEMRLAVSEGKVSRFRRGMCPLSEADNLFRVGQQRPNSPTPGNPAITLQECLTHTLLQRQAGF